MIHCDRAIRFWRSKTQPENSNPKKIANEKFLETKSNILGTSQTIVMTFLSMAALVPSILTKSYAKAYPDQLNAGFGRFCVYFSKITIPTVFFLTLPLLMYAFNTKVRRTVIRELKIIFRNHFGRSFLFEANI